jgi:hypothetical protein
VTLAWVLMGAWSALILYVIVDVRRVMAFNSRRNEEIGLGLPTSQSDRSVLINRIALVVLLIGSDLLLVLYLL